MDKVSTSGYTRDNRPKKEELLALSPLPEHVFLVSSTRWMDEITQLRAGTHRMRRRLNQLQGEKCYWCHKPLTPQTTTREHVIRRTSPSFQALAPEERALAIRLAHRDCNQRHNQWSRRRPTLARSQDERLAMILQDIMHEEPQVGSLDLTAAR